MTARSWLDDEPRFGDCARRMGPLLVTALVAISVLQNRAYTPRFVFRVIETDHDPRNHPRPRRQLADYVRNGVFTSAPLLEIIHRFGLYPGLARKNSRAALDSFRDDIDVDVYRNYFVEERSADSAPRSARLAIAYRNPNLDLAVSVTRALGALVVDHERTARRDLSARAAVAARRELDAGREVLESRQLELASRRAALERATARDPEAEVQLAELSASADGLALRQDAAEKHEAALAVGAALESGGLGLAFETIDDASLPERSGRYELELAVLGASFLFGLPLVALAVGAFVPKRGHA